ncbi:MAG: substrate-binding domain-containing protein [Bacteroidetes bacterium]|nr:substrate-binding domain-containing protein [Bacteroidota bacterium]
MFRYLKAVVFSCIVCCLIAPACNNKAKKNYFTDTPKNGTINISVDESFKPVIEQAIEVYEGSNPGTKIIAHYKTESECFKDLYSDTSNRLVIVTRALNSNESRYFTDSLGYRPPVNLVAWDAVTVVVNKESTDTLYTLQRLQQLLQGKLGKSTKVVFDGLTATSTVHFALDSILHGGSFDTSVVQAVPSSNEVLNYVADHKDAVGFVGISWIGNPEDTAQVNMLKKVKMAYVQCNRCDSMPYVKPTQSGIITKRYPLVRGLYCIVKENFSGLGSGFVGFLNVERGQLLFRRAYLGPVMDFSRRIIDL